MEKGEMMAIQMMMMDVLLLEQLKEDGHVMKQLPHLLQSV